MSKTNLILAAVMCIAAFLAIAGVNHTAPDEFTSWKRQFGIVYAQEENIYRENIFKRNLEHINKHNSLLGRGYDMGTNQFTGLTSEEFQKLHLMPALEFNAADVEAPRQSVTGPTIDWEVAGMVTRVRNQGSCVASYAFSAVGAVESLSAIFYRSPQEFSAQQVVDCSSTYGNTGCSAGRMDNTFSYVTDRGIAYETDYPWSGQQRQCQSSRGSFNRVIGYRNVTTCDNLAYFLATQPVSVLVDGTNFQYYRSGIYGDCGTSLNAGLLLIGMNDNAWRLKNSFGTSWGEQGYIRFYRGNTCGLCLQASFPNPQ
jgi:hypothetical protein